MARVTSVTGVHSITHEPAVHLLARGQGGEARRCREEKKIELFCDPCQLTLLMAGIWSN